MSEREVIESRKTTAKKESGPKAFDPQKYSDVVETAELGDVLLVSCRFDIESDYYAQRVRGSGRSSKLKHNVGCTIENPNYDPSDGLVGANFKWEIRVKSGRKQVAKLICDYICYYSGLNDKSEAAAIAFLTRVGRFATYPYFRAVASQFSWASYADFPILPVLKEPAKRSKSQSAPK